MVPVVGGPAQGQLAQVAGAHHQTAGLTDYFAIGQCTPGIIAVNTATFIGHKYKGLAGGILATLGVVGEEPAVEAFQPFQDGRPVIAVPQGLLGQPENLTGLWTSMM